MKVARGEAATSSDRMTIALGVVLLVSAIFAGAVGLMLWISPAFLLGLLILMVSFSLAYWGLYLVVEGGAFRTDLWSREVRWKVRKFDLLVKDGSRPPLYMRELLDQDHLVPWEHQLPEVDPRTRNIIRIGGISMVLAGVYSMGFGLFMALIPPGFILTPSYLVLGILSFYYGIRFLQRKHRIRIVMVLVLLMAGNGLVLFMFEGTLGRMGTALSIVGIISLTLSWKYFR